MTSQGIKFYKFNNSTGSSASKIATAKATEGAVIYLVDVRELWIGGSTPKLVIKGANDVTFANNVLTLTHYDNAGVATTDTLDFSDVASASSTMAVFEQIYTKMGLTGASHDTLDYTGTNYLTSATNLVDADKALDTAIHTNTHKGAATGANYDTQHLSQTWTTVVTNNTIAANDTLDADIDKLDKKVAGLADEVIANEQVTQEAFTAVANSVGLESDMSLDLSTASETGAIHGDTDVKSALIHLDNAISTNQLDVQVDENSIVSNHVANINTEDTYNASTNKLATKATVTNAINALDVTEYAQAEIDTATTSGETAFKVKGIKEVDGKIEVGTNTVDLKIDGTYNASTNMIATESTVSNAIDGIAGAGLAVASDGTVTATTQSTSDDQANVATTEFVHNVVETLNTQNDVQAVDYTAATSSTGAKLTFKGVSETDGVIAQGTGTDELQFAKVATTGAAADVSIADSEGHTAQTTVEGAIDEIYDRIEAMEGSFDVIKSVDAATTPQGVTWIDDSDPQNPQTITGTLVASADTFHKVYLVKKLTTPTPAPTPETNNTYTEYITTRTNTGTEQAPVYVYGWEKLGDIAIDLTGYVKSVTVNGTSHAVDTNSTNVTLGNIINDVTGETAITGGESGLVAVTPTNTTDANGVRTSDLATTVKIEEVADGIVKDGTASYTEGHYVIENGKLVSAVGKSTGDTYTISANDGLTKASDVAAYVESKTGEGISSLDVPEYQQASVDVDTTNHASTLKIKGIKEDDGKIAAATTTPTTDVEIEGEYNASTNKLATQSTVTNAIDGLDVNEYAQASVDVDTTNHASTLKIKGIKEVDGKIAAATTAPTTDVAIDGEYNASTNKIATKSTVTNAIDDIAGAGLAVDNAGAITATTQQTSDNTTNVATTEFVHNVVETLDGSATIASVANNVVTIKTGVAEADGVISNATGTDIVLEEVAVTGAASDVSYDNTTSGMTATTVQAAIDELKSGLCWEEYEQ